ncbi:MAG TPA: hypothetical protein VLX28_27885 [Thermoanaerobaculia bacterium]|nr:hypothetical protein [Thermoanaerobaculia bacterium]
MTLEYPYKLEPQESGGFIVQFLDIEDAFTEGATPEECAREWLSKPRSGPTGRENGAQG